MPTNYITYDQAKELLLSKSIFQNTAGGNLAINVKGIGDNMVGFMSQIGWTENSGSSPNKRIAMEKIFIDVNTDGGNGGGAYIWEVAVTGQKGANILHVKVNCRIPVCNKIIEYLGE